MHALQKSKVQTLNDTAAWIHLAEEEAGKAAGQVLQSHTLLVLIRCVDCGSQTQRCLYPNLYEYVILLC